jgi:membrane-associated phospholipid phosphatase
VTDKSALTELEIKALQAVQQGVGQPGVVKAARGLSHFGEHALGWLAIGLIGAAVDKPKRKAWLAGAAGVALAHGASIGVKRVIRRPRPDDDRVKVGVGTPSKLSFPSSHATSTAAAAVIYSHLTGRKLVRYLVPPMVLSRLVLGVHYPSDVATGTILGASIGALTNKLSTKNTEKK